MNGTLFRHIGGKNGTMGAELAALLPKQKPDIYIEPFGGSFGLGIQSDYDPSDVYMIHNDLDNIIHAIFKAVTYDSEKRLMQFIPYWTSMSIVRRQWIILDLCLIMRRLQEKTYSKMI